MFENDSEIKKLIEERGTIDVKIKHRKIAIAMEKGEIVDSIEKLKCEKHLDSAFEIIGKIKESEFVKTFDGLNIYQCKECRDKKIPLFISSRAYDCPECGIVIGDYIREDYCSPEESWHALAGREGEHYHCRICGTQLGWFYWRIS